MVALELLESATSINQATRFLRMPKSNLRPFSVTSHKDSGRASALNSQTQN